MVGEHAIEIAQHDDQIIPAIAIEVGDFHCARPSRHIDCLGGSRAEARGAVRGGMNNDGSAIELGGDEIEDAACNRVRDRAHIHGVHGITRNRALHLQYAVRAERQDPDHIGFIVGGHDLIARGSSGPKGGHQIIRLWKGSTDGVHGGDVAERLERAIPVATVMPQTIVLASHGQIRFAIAIEIACGQRARSSPGRQGGG